MVYSSEMVPFNGHRKWTSSFLKYHYATYFGSKVLILTNKRLTRLVENNYASFNEKYTL